MKEFAVTKTATHLSKDGMRLRLENPASVFSPGAGCKSPPYGLPDKAGGFVTLVEFGEPECAEGCGPRDQPKSSGNGCGCGGKTCGHSRCDNPTCGVTNPNAEMEKTLRRWEVVRYSGYEKDGQTLKIIERAYDGLTEQEWPAGTLVMQSRAAPYISRLEKLGCLLALPKAKDCMAVKAGQWVADPTCSCWRQAKKDGVIVADPNGEPDFPAPGQPETEMWSECYRIDDLLSLLKDQGGIDLKTFLAVANGINEDNSASDLSYWSAGKPIPLGGNNPQPARLTALKHAKTAGDFVFTPDGRIKANFDGTQNVELTLAGQLTSGGQTPFGQNKNSFIDYFIEHADGSPATKIAHLMFTSNDYDRPNQRNNRTKTRVVEMKKGDKIKAVFRQNDAKLRLDFVSALARVVAPGVLGN